MGRPSKYPRELRERAVRMVAEVRPDYPSEYAAILVFRSRRYRNGSVTLTGVSRVFLPRRMCHRRKMPGFVS